MKKPLIWVVSLTGRDDVPGRLGDARELADRSQTGVGLLVLMTGESVDDSSARSWIAQGADEVHLVTFSKDSQGAAVDFAQTFLAEHPPRLVIVSADPCGRAWSARLAARIGWPLVSPVLMLQEKSHRWVVTRIDFSGRRAQRLELATETPVLIGLRPGVAQPLPPENAREGIVCRREIAVDTEHRVLNSEYVPPDPQQADIRHLSKLVAGGKGVGGRDGFDLLRRVAHKLGAGVAASRMAVDLGWIEPERQVGQTGKTVRPDLYLACGISGASHHLEGMSDSRQIVAINTDAQAPLMRKAHLSFQTDLHETLAELSQLMETDC